MSLRACAHFHSIYSVHSANIFAAYKRKYAQPDHDDRIQDQDQETHSLVNPNLLLLDKSQALIIQYADMLQAKTDLKEHHYDLPSLAPAGQRPQEALPLPHTSLVLTSSGTPFDFIETVEAMKWRLLVP